MVEIVKEALKSGILVKMNDEWIVPPGILSLTYNYMNGKYILVFGSNQQNAGYVAVEDYLKTWKRRND